MKVLLIFPSTGFFRSALLTLLGLLSIATYLKANGLDVKICDKRDEFKNRL